MSDKPMLWMRREYRHGESRAPIAPRDAKTLVDAGFDVVVEESHIRVFPVEDYVAAGCQVAPSDTWPDAPRHAIVIGLMELPAGNGPLRDHIFFGHAFKGQDGAEALLARFASGGGTLLDLEYLVDDDGNRLAAFGYWAGYVGAALAVLEQRGQLPRRLRPTTRARLDERLVAGSASSAGARALVIGALGRSGRGACDALEVAGVETTCWDVDDTTTIDKSALLDHDILVNAVMVTSPVAPFVTTEDLFAPARRLSVISDVTCDVTSDCNVLPIYRENTSWLRPVRDLPAGAMSASLIAIDNLATMLPVESSITYSEQLLPVLLQLPDGAPWRRARETFAAHAPATAPLVEQYPRLGEAMTFERPARRAGFVGKRHLPRNSHASASNW